MSAVRTRRPSAPRVRAGGTNGADELPPPDIFYGLGFGLFGRVPLAIALAGAVVFFVLQMFGSAVWLAYARFGPSEYAWRVFTYRSRVPLLQ